MSVMLRTFNLLIGLLLRIM